jgi:hypothetical protein
VTIADLGGCVLVRPPLHQELDGGAYRISRGFTAAAAEVAAAVRR